MGWRDRPYARHDYGSGPPRFGGVMTGMPRPGRIVSRLLLINIVVFFLTLFFREFFLVWGTVRPDVWYQPWRYVTFQFLHAGLFHILFNMIGLYFLGMMLEAGWGPRRFLVFYLSCGAFAGAAHVIMAFALGRGMNTMLLGASGGVYAVVLACAVLYPHVRVILFLFPVPIRFAAALFLGIAAYNTLGEITSGGVMRSQVSDVAHLGGAAAAAVWIWVVPRLRGTAGSVAGRINKGAWERKMKRRAEDEAEIDRILEKIHRRGLNSLNRKERKILQEAARRQEREERQIYRP